MSEVEFHNGHAVEQHTEGEDSSPNENREAAKKAVADAIKAAEGKEPKKPKSASKPPPVNEDEADDEDEGEAGKVTKAKHDSAPKSGVKKPVKDVEAGNASEDASDPANEEESTDAEDAEGAHKKNLSDLRKVLDGRSKAAKEKAKAAEARDKAQRELIERKAALDYQEQQLRQQAQFYENLRKSPVEAIQHAGWDPESLILDLAQHGTPEAKAEARMRMLEQRLEQEAQWKQQFMQQVAQAQEQRKYEQQVTHRQSVEDRFLKIVTDPKKSPHTAAFYKGREAALISEGDIIAAQYQQLTGKVAEPEDVAEYIEEQMASLAKAWYDSKSPKQEEAEDDDSDESTEQSVGEKRSTKKMPKTLNGDGKGSERRALQKNLSDLDEDELRQVAKDNVKVALAKHRSPRN